MEVEKGQPVVIINDTGIEENRRIGEKGVISEIKYGDFPIVVDFPDGSRKYNEEELKFICKKNHHEAVYHDKTETWVCPFCDL